MHDMLPREKASKTLYVLQVDMDCWEAGQSESPQG